MVSPSNPLSPWTQPSSTIAKGNPLSGVQHSCLTCCDSIPFEVYKVISMTRLWANGGTSSFCSLAFEKKMYPSPFEPPGPRGSHRGQCRPRCTQDESASRKAWSIGKLLGLKVLRGHLNVVFESLWCDPFSCSITTVDGLINYENCRICQSFHYKIKLTTVMTSLLQCVCLPKPNLRNKSSKCVV